MKVCDFCGDIKIVASDGEVHLCKKHADELGVEYDEYQFIKKTCAKCGKVTTIEGIKCPECNGNLKW